MSDCHARKRELIGGNGKEGDFEKIVGRRAGGFFAWARLSVHSFFHFFPPFLPFNHKLRFPHGMPGNIAYQRKKRQEQAEADTAAQPIPQAAMADAR